MSELFVEQFDYRKLAESVIQIRSLRPVEEFLMVQVRPSTYEAVVMFWTHLMTALESKPDLLQMIERHPFGENPLHISLPYVWYRFPLESYSHERKNRFDRHFYDFYEQPIPDVFPAEPTVANFRPQLDALETQLKFGFRLEGFALLHDHADNLEQLYACINRCQGQGAACMLRCQLYEELWKRGFLALATPPGMAWLEDTLGAKYDPFYKLSV